MGALSDLLDAAARGASPRLLCVQEPTGGAFASPAASVSLFCSLCAAPSRLDGSVLLLLDECVISLVRELR